MLHEMAEQAARSAGWLMTDSRRKPAAGGTAQAARPHFVRKLARIGRPGWNGRRPALMDRRPIGVRCRLRAQAQAESASRFVRYALDLRRRGDSGRPSRAKALGDRRPAPAESVVAFRDELFDRE